MDEEDGEEEEVEEGPGSVDESGGCGPEEGGEEFESVVDLPCDPPPARDQELRLLLRPVRHGVRHAHGFRSLSPNLKCKE